MSKSLNNYIGIDEDPQSIFGKIMSISDEMMWKYYTLLTDLTPPEIAELRRRVSQGEYHPMEAKTELAKTIIRDFYDQNAADAAAAEFRRIFSDRQVPTDVEERELPASTESVPLVKLVTS